MSCVIVTLHRVLVVCLYLISTYLLLSLPAPCPHRIRDRNCRRFNGIDSRWDATDVNPSFRLPRRESSSIGFDLCDEITCPPALCAIISPAAPLSLSLQSYPVPKEESPRRVKADERRSRTSARKAEIDFFSCTTHFRMTCDFRSPLRATTPSTNHTEIRSHVYRLHERDAMPERCEPYA